jgi:diguanylate cyclase (GGDEF)-like protein
MELLNEFTRWDRRFVLGIDLGLIMVIGLTDYLTGYELAFSLFYVFPIALTTWSTSRRYGTGVALLSTLVWLAADIQDGYRYSSLFIHYWNAGIRFGFFIIIVFLLNAFQKAHEHEIELARTDSLTGAANSRHFQELLRIEMSRSQRYHRPLTLVYLDVDNFKALNDTFGHSAGDEALTTIVNYLKTRLRRSDVIARLGGDEFALLLAETDERAARSVVSKLQQGLAELSQPRHWKISFSIGVLTCNDGLCTPDQIVSAADRLMYTAKQGGKNAAVFHTDKYALPSKPFLATH